MLEVERVTQSVNTRRRLKALSHIPLTAAFSLCELNLSAMLPPDALHAFAPELQRRAARRQEAADQVSSPVLLNKRLTSLIAPGSQPQLAAHCNATTDPTTDHQGSSAVPGQDSHRILAGFPQQHRPVPLAVCGGLATTNEPCRQEASDDGQQPLRSEDAFCERRSC